MDVFINSIFDFFNTIYDGIFNWFYGRNQYSFISAFWDKKVLDGELLSIGMTWGELLRIVIPMAILLILVYLIFRTFWNLMTGRSVRSKKL